jgi:hypothetical protein
LETDSDEAGSSDSDRDVDTSMDTDTPSEDKTLFLRLGTKFIFGQEHRILGVLVVSTFSLEVPMD